MTEGRPVHQLLAAFRHSRFTPPAEHRFGDVSRHQHVVERREFGQQMVNWKTKPKVLFRKVSRSRPGRLSMRLPSAAPGRNRVIERPEQCENVLFRTRRPDDADEFTVSTRRLVPFSTRTVSA